MWMRLTRTFVTASRKHPKRLSHTVIEATTFRVGMQTVNPSIELSCSLLMETTQVWLLQVYLSNLTGSERIDGPKQFGEPTFHTLVANSWSFLNNFTNRSRYSPCHCSIFSWSEMGDMRLLTASYLVLFLKKCLTFGGPLHQNQ